MYKNPNWIMIGLIIMVLIVLWLLISFITMDLGWPINTAAGRFFAIVIIIGVINSAIEA